MNYTQLAEHFLNEYPDYTVSSGPMNSRKPRNIRDGL